MPRPTARALVQSMVAALAVTLTCSGVAIAQPTISVLSLGHGFMPNGGNTIAAGPDGNVWFTQYRHLPGGAGILGYWHVLGRVTPSGRVTEYAACAKQGSRSPLFTPRELTKGPDGKLWIGAFARVDEAAEVLRVTVFPQRAKGADVVAPGPRRSVWFAGHPSTLAPLYVGRRDTRGRVTEFKLPRANAYGITMGPDGNMWVATGKGVLRVTPNGGVTRFSNGVAATPQAIVAGPDGNLWFSVPETDPALPYPASNPWAIGRITTSGIVSEFSAGLPGETITGLAAGPDGNVWFTQRGIGPTGVDNGPDQVGWIAPDGSIILIPSPIRLGGQSAIAQGPDGNMWLAGYQGQIARVNLAPNARPLPSHPKIPPVSTAGCNTRR